MDERTRDDRVFAYGLALVLFGGMILRLLYLIAQPAADPNFDRPMIDGAYYLEWARSLAAGTGGPTGAYYLAPLYPSTLAVFVKLAGEDFVLLYLFQQLSTVVTAGLLAVIARRGAGTVAGLTAAVLAVLYHPTWFFASAPLAESLGLLLLVIAILLTSRHTRPAAIFASGLFAGLAALARPSLLVVPIIWAALKLVTSRKAAALLLAGVALAIAPVMIRNYAASGELVPISANTGLTLYHGNGPGAVGTFTRPEGFSGAVERQREEATLLARSGSGEELSDVEADRWWAQQAIQTRLADPTGSAKLLGYKLALMVDNHETALDYSPSLDRNPWRPMVRWAGDHQLAVIPFALLLGLAVGGLYQLGVAGSGGSSLWSALVGCAVAPIVFYVSSRYRLPVSVLLTVPAGCGLAGLADRISVNRKRGRPGALVLTGAVVAASFLMPSSSARELESATGLMNRAIAHMEAQQPESALRDAQAAIAIHPSSPVIQYNYGALLAAQGDVQGAEAAYRTAWRLDPTMIYAGCNLGNLLVESGRPSEAIPILTDALREDPSSEVCWTVLVVAHAESGDLAKAADTIDAATAQGVALPPDLVEAVHEAMEQ